MKKTLSSGFLLVLVLLVALAAGPVYGGNHGEAQGERVPVFVGFTNQPGPAEEALVRKADGEIKYTYNLVPAIAASLPEGAIRGLLNNPNVKYIEPDLEVHAVDHPNGDAELQNTWGVAHIKSGSVHVAGNKGVGVKVAVIDTGIDYTHPDLDDYYAGGYDFVNNDDDPMDDNGHGTHVSGTVAAEDNNNGVVGVAPKATLYALKVLDDEARGSWSDVVAAVQWAVDHGVQVTNNSYGSSRKPWATVKTAFDNANAAGILQVAAAGNTGNKCIYPARWDSLIATAATDSNDDRASFSSICTEVELAAPGVSVKSTMPGGGYGTKNGTSMASPHVAGTAALVLWANPGWNNYQVRTQLQVTAEDLGTSGRDDKFGYGLVQANGAALSDPSNDPPNDPLTVSISSPADGSNPASGATISFTGTAIDTEDGSLTASLSWTSDIDGPIGSGGSLSTTLSDGLHTITASVVDSGGKTGSESISITVGNPPPKATTVRVTTITYLPVGGKTGDKHLNITLALEDDLRDPVAGASVSIDLFHDGSLAASGTGTTETNGTVTFSLKNAKSGEYTTTVTTVTANGLTWDGITPDNSFTK